jgi:hypothetical protein
MSDTPTLDLVTKRLMGAETVVLKAVPESQKGLPNACRAIGKEVLVIARNQDGYLRVESATGVRLWVHESQVGPHDS